MIVMSDTAAQEGMSTHSQLSGLLDCIESKSGPTSMKASNLTLRSPRVRGAMCEKRKLR